MALPKLTIPPDQDNYSVIEFENVVSVKLDGGSSRFRLDKTSSIGKATVQWTVNEENYRYLRDFYRLTKNGALTFLIDLLYDTPYLTELEAKFVPDSFKLARQQGKSFTVTAELEIKPPPVDIEALYMALFPYIPLTPGNFIRVRSDGLGFEEVAPPDTIIDGVWILGPYTTATRPTPSVTYVRRLISVIDPGMPEELQYCRQTADGGYEWVIVAF
jgi:hypothetical protein